MPTDKFTRLIRSRMKATGESFQTARLALLQQDVEIVREHTTHILTWRPDDPSEWPDITAGVVLLGRAGTDPIEPDPEWRLPVNFQHPFHPTDDGLADSNADVYPAEPDAVLRHIERIGPRPAGVFGAYVWVEHDWLEPPFPKNATLVIAAVRGLPAPFGWFSNYKGRRTIRELSSLNALPWTWAEVAEQLADWINDRPLPELAMAPHNREFLEVSAFCRSGPVFDPNRLPSLDAVVARTTEFRDVVRSLRHLSPLYRTGWATYAELVLALARTGTEFYDVRPEAVLAQPPMRQELDVARAFGIGPELQHMAMSGCYGPTAELLESFRE